VADVFDHVTIRVSDVEASLRFYELAFAQLGHEASHRGDGFYEWNDFSIWAAESGKPVTRGLHVALVADSRAAVDEWWRAMDAINAAPPITSAIALAIFAPPWTDGSMGLA